MRCYSEDPFQGRIVGKSLPENQTGNLPRGNFLGRSFEESCYGLRGDYLP